jgi:PleD family two-component response regulator
VTELAPAPEEAIAALARADGALYEAKAAGRNRTVVRR